MIFAFNYKVAFNGVPYLQIADGWIPLCSIHGIAKHVVWVSPCNVEDIAGFDFYNTLPKSLVKAVKPGLLPTSVTIKKKMNPPREQEAEKFTAMTGNIANSATNVSVNNKMAFEEDSSNMYSSLERKTFTYGVNGFSASSTTTTDTAHANVNVKKSFSSVAYQIHGKGEFELNKRDKIDEKSEEKVENNMTFQKDDSVMSMDEKKATASSGSKNVTPPPSSLLSQQAPVVVNPKSKNHQRMKEITYNFNADTISEISKEMKNKKIYALNLRLRNLAKQVKQINLVMEDLTNAFDDFFEGKYLINMPLYTYIKCIKYIFTCLF